MLGSWMEVFSPTLPEEVMCPNEMCRVRAKLKRPATPSQTKATQSSSQREPLKHTYVTARVFYHADTRSRARTFILRGTRLAGTRATFDSPTYRSAQGRLCRQNYGQPILPFLSHYPHEPNGHAFYSTTKTPTPRPRRPTIANTHEVHRLQTNRRTAGINAFLETILRTGT